MSQPKAIRVVPKSDTKPELKPEQIQLITNEVTEAVKVKSPVPYEKRLEKMSNNQLRGEIRKGQKGKLSGYVSVPLAIVLGVILDSHERGMKPFIS